MLFLFSFNEQLWPFSFEVLNDQKAIEVCWVFFSPPTFKQASATKAFAIAKKEQ